MRSNCPLLRPLKTKAGAMMVRTIVLVGWLLAIVAVAACGQQQGAAKDRFCSVPGGSEDVGRGEELFKGNCAVCHGVYGEGQPDWQIRKPDGVLPAPPLNGDGHTWHHGDGTLFRIVSLGGAIYESPDLPGYKSGMPAFGEKLSHD